MYKNNNTTINNTINITLTNFSNENYNKLTNNEQIFNLNFLNIKLVISFSSCTLL
jgi:hypothetical protein